MPRKKQEVVSDSEDSSSEDENIDRSKRVAPGCKIDTKNILDTPRKRSNVNYSQTSLGPDNRLRERNPPKKEEKQDEQKTKKSVGKRKRIEDKEETTSKKKKTEKAPKNEKGAEKGTKKKDDVKATAQKKTKETTKNEVLKKNAKNDSKKDDKSKDDDAELAKSVKNHLKKLGVKIPEPSERRKYRGIHWIPSALEVFNRISWPSRFYKNKKYNLTSLEFVEWDLDESDRKDYPFLLENKDYCMIGESDSCVLATRIENETDPSNFGVFLLYDNKDVRGPYKLSTLLTGIEVDKDANDAKDEE
ncbi:transcriptional regulatory protein rxt3 [Acrasis kona]|uniref:Transcriptional regulatory protein rxt3 n=1 Tax=Acrasis kona TaxID=1008807 RepID=A0AAW2ZN93_9EUKA